MKHSRTLPLVLATLLLAASGVAQAQGTSPSREQVKMERDAFLKIMSWDELSSQWVLKSGMMPPAGVMDSEEIKASRAKFFTMNRWDENQMGFVSVGPTPRDMSKVSREQVERDTRMFLMTHRWDEDKSMYVMKNK